MGEAIISDVLKTIKLTIRGDLIDEVKEDELVQIVNVSAPEYNKEIVLTTYFSTSI